MREKKLVQLSLPVVESVFAISGGGCFNQVAEYVIFHLWILSQLLKRWLFIQVVTKTGSTVAAYFSSTTDPTVLSHVNFYSCNIAKSMVHFYLHCLSSNQLMLSVTPISNFSQRVQMMKKLCNLCTVSFSLLLLIVSTGNWKQWKWMIKSLITQ